jgi:hypothetical protein
LHCRNLQFRISSGIQCSQHLQDHRKFLAESQSSHRKLVCLIMCIEWGATCLGTVWEWSISTLKSKLHLAENTASIAVFVIAVFALLILGYTLCE